VNIGLGMGDDEFLLALALLLRDGRREWPSVNRDNEKLLL